jgi:hypothetical protein
VKIEELLEIAFNILDSLSDKQIYLESLVTLAPFYKQFNTKMTFDDICDLIVSESKANPPSSRFLIRILDLFIENNKYQEAEGLLSIKAYDRDSLGKIKTFFYKTVVKKCLNNDTYKSAETYIDKYYNGLSKYQFDREKFWMPFSDSLIEVISQCESKKLTKLWGRFSQKSCNKKLSRNIYLANRLTDAKDVSKFEVQRNEVETYGESGRLLSYLIDAYAEAKKGNFSTANGLVNGFKLDEPSFEIFKNEAANVVDLLSRLAELFYQANKKQAAESAADHAYRLLNETPINFYKPLDNSKDINRSKYSLGADDFPGTDLEFVVSIIPKIMRFSSFRDEDFLKLIPESTKKDYSEKLIYYYCSAKIYGELNIKKVDYYKKQFVKVLPELTEHSNESGWFMEYCVELGLYKEFLDLLSDYEKSSFGTSSRILDGFRDKYGSLNETITHLIRAEGRDNTENYISRMAYNGIRDYCYSILADSYIEIGDFENTFRLNSLITNKKAGLFIIKQTAQLFKNITSAAQLNKFKNSLKKYFPKDAVNWLN